MTTTTLTHNGNGDALADELNALYAKHPAMTVNGQAVRTYGKKPATGWGTGSVSIDVAARTTRGINHFWVKPGQTVRVNH